MGRVSPTLGDRWRSANQVGGAAPSARITVTRGLIDKHYAKFVPLPGPEGEDFRDFPEIVDGHNHEPWQGFWRATGEPKELPNIYTIRWQQDFSQKGMRTATVEVENVVYKTIVGAGGIYHAIMRGALSPWLGLKLINRIEVANWEADEWSEVLDGGFRIDIYEGYGDEMTKTFCGVIETADIETRPDRVILTARDWGILFTDQRFMGANKPPEIRSPLQAADRHRTEQEKYPGLDWRQNHKGWLLVEDATDVAKAVFLWAGFKEWRIDRFGWSLTKPMAWDMSKFFIEALEDLEAQADWVFFMESPTALAESMGRPVFEHNTATNPPKRGMLEVRDTDLLETIKLKLDTSNLPYVIRYRGDVDNAGTTYDGDQVKRYNGTYFPPWSGAGPFITQPGRTGGVRRHELTIDSNLQSDEECIFAAILAAWQYALEAYTAEVQISGYPGMELNDHISVVDHATGVNSRLWVSGIQSEHTCGAKAAWKMTVVGAVLDNKDTQQLAKDLEAAKLIAAALKAERLKWAGEPIL